MSKLSWSWLRLFCASCFLLPYWGSAQKIAAADKKTVYALYEEGSRLQSIALEGIRSKLSVTPLVLGNEGELKSCDSKAAAVIAIGKPALDKAIEYCRSTPVVFSLVSAPRFGKYPEYRNVTGVSFDLSFRLYLAELRKILKPGARIGFVYSSGVNDFLTAEMNYIESENEILGVREQIETREQIGPTIKRMIEEQEVKGIWVLPDPLYNQTIFRKLATLCKEKGVLLITNFEALVTDAGAAIALAPGYFDTGVQTAELVQKILAGTPPHTIAYQRPRESGVYLNLKLFEELKIALPNDLKFRERVTALLDEAHEMQKAGNTAGALEKFRAVLKYDKKNSTAIYFVNLITARENFQTATARLQSGNRWGALPLLVASAPFLAEANKRLAALRAELRGDVNTIFNQGVAHFKNRRYKECIQSMNLVLMADPGNREAQVYKEKSGKRAKAVAALR